jgi:hypothetical protein
MTASFNDWKRLCFVLREIASGGNGRPLSGLEAQKQAQAVLTECGYTCLIYAEINEATAAAEKPRALADFLIKAAQSSGSARDAQHDQPGTNAALTRGRVGEAVI